jgi:small subunit ribosomal protein S15
MVYKSKETIIKEFKKSENDTGSTAVQIALLTDKIIALGDHFKKFPKDFSSRRGLTIMVAQRRKLLNYLEKTDSAACKELIQRLNIRG